MNINAQDLMLIRRNMKFGETKPTTSTAPTVAEPTVTKPESNLSALDIQANNNIAFQGTSKAVRNVLDNLKHKGLPLLFAATMGLGGVMSMQSCEKDETIQTVDVNVDVSALVDAIYKAKDDLVAGQEKTDALLLEVISLLQTNNRISAENQELLMTAIACLKNLDKNDKEGMEILNAILERINYSIEQNKKMDQATVDLLTKIANNQEKFGTENKELLTILIQKVDNIDATVKTEIGNVIESVDELGDEQKVMLTKILSAITSSNKLSVENNALLAVVVKQLGQLDKNDKSSFEMLNKIWVSLEKAIKENKEMDGKTHALLKAILENIQNFSEENKQNLMLLIESVKNLDASVANAFAKLFGKMDNIGNDGQKLLNEILNQVNNGNKINAKNGEMLSLILEAMSKVNANDNSDTIGLLKNIWNTLQAHMKQDAEMDGKTHALLKAILENIQSFSEENKQNLMLLIESVKNLDASVANAFTKLFGKMDNIGNDGQKLLNEILNQVNNGNKINAKNGEILSSILEAMGNANSSDNTEVIGLLKNIWNTLQAHMKQDAEMDAKTHSLLQEVLKNVQNFNEETTTLLKEILAKSDKLGAEQVALLKVIVANQEKLQEQGKDATNKILEAINKNTEIAKGTNTLVAEILENMDKFDKKGDKILDAIAKISVGGNVEVDLSTVESMLADILEQEKANGEVLSSADAKASLVLVSLEGIKNAIDNGNQAIIDKIQEVIDNMPESCNCNASLKTIIEKLQEIIDNTKNNDNNNEGADGPITDLEDFFS